MEPTEPRFDQDNADLLVFTFKEGLLSAMAHDLKLRVTQFSIAIDEATRAIEVRVEPRSLRVVTAMKNGAEAGSALSASDREKIEDNLLDDVLQPEKFPEIRFTSSSVDEVDSGYRIRGRLTLCGQSREIEFLSRSDGEGQVAEIELHQPDWGITPYSAMLGTLKVKPKVIVRVALPGLL